MATNNATVLPGRETIEIYVSEMGLICLKQENPNDEVDVVSMLPSDVPAVVAALTRLSEDQNRKAV